MARSVQVKTDLGLKSDRIGVRIRLDGTKLRGRPASLVAKYEGVTRKSDTMVTKFNPIPKAEFTERANVCSLP